MTNYKLYIGLCLILQATLVFSQKETDWWHFGKNVAINFSSGGPVYSFNSSISANESAATISDTNGNLLFYTDGVTVWDKTNSIMQNGNLISQYASITYTGTTASITQGSYIVKKPRSGTHYYIFSLGNFYQAPPLYLKYTLVDMSLNSGNGAVISKNNLLVGDTLLEKMTSTKHCNSIDEWVVTVKKNHLGKPNESYTFLSYLITKNGIHPFPVRSSMTLPFDLSMYGQLKFNPKGTILASGQPNGISIFDFDKQTGKVSLNRFINLPLRNGYGLEFSPDGTKLYINEKQYDFTTGTFTSLLNYDCPGQLQMARDGRIYKIHFPKAEITKLDPDNGFSGSNSINNAFRITQIKNPNVLGIGCGFDTTYIYDLSANYPNYPLGLPNFPSYYFHKPLGEFSYSGYCAGSTFQFYLSNTAISADSIKWTFHDTNQSTIGQTATHLYNHPGEYQVSSIIYSNGLTDTTTQCVTVCGSNFNSLPDTITSCIGSFSYLNGASSCGSRYKWNTGDTLPEIMINQSGNYTLEIKSDCGTFYETVFVNLISCDPEYLIPNVFTPNGDGVNDTYSVHIKNVKEIEYFIYDRWGKLVKQHQEAVNIYNSFTAYDIWDGKQNDIVHSDGTYFMVLNLKSYDNKIIVAKQFITLFEN